MLRRARGDDPQAIMLDVEEDSWRLRYRRVSTPVHVRFVVLDFFSPVPIEKAPLAMPAEVYFRSFIAKFMAVLSAAWRVPLPCMQGQGRDPGHRAGPSRPRGAGLLASSLH